MSEAIVLMAMRSNFLSEDTRTGTWEVDGLFEQVFSPGS
jgi:hypothetical protein